ncbi:MAG: hypothetical protein ABI330_17825 [Caldimonas sp.]
MSKLDADGRHYIKRDSYARWLQERTAMNIANTISDINKTHWLRPASDGIPGGGVPAALWILFTGRFEETIVAADKAYREQPNFLPALRVKLAAAAAAMAMAGRTQDMEDALARLRSVQRDISLPTLMRIHTSHLQAQRDAYEIALRKAGLS